MMTDFDTMQQNIFEVREKMQKAAATSLRKIDDIVLCAASKTQSVDTVALSRGLNIDIFGENRVQELVEKYDAQAYGQKPCHLIGHLQTNKVRQVVGRAEVIQSVDSIRLMDEIAREALKKGIVQKIMVEINIGGEESKNGIILNDFELLLENATQKSSINLCGIMSIPPISEKKGQNRYFFSTLYKLFIDTRAKKYDNVSICYLSMGMSGDFEDAIQEGANLIRIGTAIFGKRN